jgi:hypothetical protein
MRSSIGANFHGFRVPCLDLYVRIPQTKCSKRVNFKDIVKLETLSDDEHVVLVYLASRVMRLSLKDSLPFLVAVQRNMKVGRHIWRFHLF